VHSAGPCFLPDLQPPSDIAFAAGNVRFRRVLHCLIYQQGDLQTVLIVEASFIGAARVRVDLETPGLDDHFVEAHELDQTLARQIPKCAIDRMMTVADAVSLIEHLDRIPKRPPPPSARAGRRRLRRVAR